MDPEQINKDMLAEAERSRHEFVVAASGKVAPRPEGTINKKLATGEIEVRAEQFHILSESKTPPFEIADETSAKEQLRLEYRYLDLRRSPLQEKIKQRHDITLAVRNYLRGQGFY